MASGDEQALGALYDRYATTIHTLAYYLLGQADEAEDAVEETFWQAWREAGRYDSSRGAVSRGCPRSREAARSIAQRARKRRAEEPLEGVVAGSARRGATSPTRMEHAADPQRDAESAERARDIADRARRSFPPSSAQVIELAYFGGLSQSEIAERIALPLGTVKTRARLALEKLRAPLAQHREDAR